MRLYRGLLRLYPASFRAEFGGEMAAIFARRHRESTGVAVIGLWLEVIADVVTSAAAVHLDILRSDLRYCARAFARTPGFAMAGTLIVGFGIGATTAAFSVIDLALIRPLRFPAAERLLDVWERLPGYARMGLSPANYRDIARATRSFERFAAWRGLAINLTGSAESLEPQHLQGAAVTADLFQVLGVNPLAGRLFDENDDREGAPGAVMLSYRLWQTGFGGDEAVIGRTVRLDDRPYTVIGIMPPSFSFPRRDAALWTAMRFQAAEFQDRNNNFLAAVGRLVPGISQEQVRAELSVLAARLKRQYPKENAHTDFTAVALRNEVSQPARLMLMAVSGASLCVLLIACANLANLLLARSMARGPELAVRMALGAGRERLIRQLLTESVALAAAGGLLGVGLARAAVPLLWRLVPTSLPTPDVPAIDLRVLAFAAVATAVTGALFGVAPVWQTGREGALHTLRDTCRAGGGRRNHLRSMLVVVEIAASVALLVSTGLLLRALWRVQATDPGFRSDGVLTLRTSLPMPRYETESSRESFYASVLSEVRASPGVLSAAYTSFLPMSRDGGIFPVSVNEIVSDRSSGHVASLRFVTPGFFRTLAIPIRRGRDVDESDVRDRPAVAVVSESFVRRYWPNRDPIGRHFGLAFADREVVGVVGDIAVRGLEGTSEPQVYLPYRQMPDVALTWYAPKDLVVRTGGSPAALVPLIRSIVRKADARQPISDVQTLADIVADQTAPRAVQVRLLAAFAVIACVLAAAGIHALLSFLVAQRAREIGVRRALGAQASDVVELVVRSSLALTACGLAPGIALAYVAARTMRGLLAGVAPDDVPAFGAAVALCAVMVLAGTMASTVRALRVDPLTALRTE